MSTVSQITVSSGIDGTTVVELTDRVNPTSGFHEDSFVNAGIFDVDDLTDTEGDMYLQQYSIDAPTATTITVEILLPDGLTNDISTTPFNIIIPKGARIRVDARDVAGAPVPGTIFFWVWSYGADSWETIQPCHVFSPCVPDGAAVVCCPPVVGNLHIIDPTGLGPLANTQGFLTLNPLAPSELFDIPIEKLVAPFTLEFKTAQLPLGNIAPTLLSSVLLPGAAGVSDSLRIDVDATNAPVGPPAAGFGLLVITTACGCCTAYAWTVAGN